jgi:O-succinylbenzoate synthase
MKIEQIVIYHIDMPLVHPFETSFGLETRRECLLLAASGAGFTGWGECVAMDRPSYSYETVGTAWHILEDFIIPSVLGRSWEDVEQFLASFNWIRGHVMARAAIQSCAWDLLAQSQGVSLAAKLAEPYLEGPRRRVMVGVSIGIQPSIKATLERIAGFLDQGFSRIKLKIKPGWDLQVLEAVRQEYPDIPLMVDANSAYSWSDLELLKGMDRFDLVMLEQPLAHDDIYQHSQLQALIHTPICLDESITTSEAAEWALAMKACRMINIKPGRVGGPWESRRIHDICLGSGIPVWCGGMLETGIGRASNLAVASLPNFTLPTDNGPTARYWEKDIVEEVFTLNREDSTITVPDKPGLGVTPDLDRIGSYLLRKKSYQV